jgi:hypothetical protein
MSTPVPLGPNPAVGPMALFWRLNLVTDPAEAATSIPAVVLPARRLVDTEKSWTPWA